MLHVYVTLSKTESGRKGAISGSKVPKIKETKVHRAPVGNHKDRKDFVISMCPYFPFFFCSPKILHSISAGQEIASAKVKCCFYHNGWRIRNS